MLTESRSRILCTICTIRVTPVVYINSCTLKNKNNKRAIAQVSQYGSMQKYVSGTYPPNCRFTAQRSKSACQLLPARKRKAPYA